MNEKETYSIICKTDAGLGYESGLVEHNTELLTLPIRHQVYGEAVQRIGHHGFDAISFSGDIPIAYFKLLSEYDANLIRQLHKSIWNQNKIPSLYIVTPAELRVYNCYAEPIAPDSTIEERLVKRVDLATETLNHYHEFAKTQFDSGIFWQSESGRKYHTDSRVDSFLLKQLSNTRNRLHSEYKLPLKIVHDLLGRSIFILYLEDRNVIQPTYYHDYFLSGTDSFLQILEDKGATYQLFNALSERFNGDVLPVSDKEYSLIMEDHLQIVRHFLSGGEVNTGQMALWRPYDFGIIPIELISAIYEEFMHQEQGEEKTSETGTYYTSHPLVEFVMNEVLPWPSPENCDYQIKVLDPACGSGIFLVEAYRRLIARWMIYHKTKDVSPSELVDILTSYIFGIDTNCISISVTAFSLYLTLLDYLQPETIWTDLTFPKLIHQASSPQDRLNLFSMSAFATDAAFENIDYDLV
ncbi:MAG: N-6 DNA methylase, partial [Chloroflexota bacterium]